MNFTIDDYIDGEKFEKVADFSFGDAFTLKKELNNFVLDDFLSNFQENRLPIIYIDSARVADLFSIVSDYEKHKFILISHNGDDTFDENFINKKPSCVIKWFGQNINFKNNESITSLPIGLERKFWSEQRYGINGYKHTKVFEYSTKKFEKNKLCYLNFNPDTNKEKRNKVLNHFGNMNWCSIRLGGIGGNLDLYFSECKESNFIVCPEGNGIDCHRNWEMLYIGCIPVIEKNIFHQEIYSTLPVLLIDSYEELTKNFLLDKIKLINENKNLEKLCFEYWKNLIMNSCSNKKNKSGT